ncbi:stage III sporulation protein AA, partial [Paenibacillus chitinolyticus]|nr:stage III sporulation protein AA [Paenibacillus chitinolyticus]
APDRPQRRAGWKVGIVDERSEIAASERGVPRFDLGPRTDVLDACPKAEGMMMMIRSMSPEVLIVDEIGRHEDAEAIREALHAGIRIIATAHGRDLGDVKRRPALRELLESGVFGRYVILGRSAAGGRLVQVLDGDGRQLAVFGAYCAPAEEKPSGWETLFSTGGRG